MPMPVQRIEDGDCLVSALGLRDYAQIGGLDEVLDRGERQLGFKTADAGLA